VSHGGEGHALGDEARGQVRDERRGRGSRPHAGVCEGAAGEPKAVRWGFCGAQGVADPLPWAVAEAAARCSFSVRFWWLNPWLQGAVGDVWEAAGVPEGGQSRHVRCPLALLLLVLLAKLEQDGLLLSR